MTDLTRDQMREILDVMLSTGADFAEIFLERRTPMVLTWEDGRLDEASSGIDEGVGLRIIRDAVAYYANGNDRSYEAVLAMAGGLARALSGTRRARAAELRESAAPVWSVVRVPPGEVSVADRVALLKRADEAARAYDPRIVQASITLVDSERQVTIANSEGVLASDRTCYLTLAAMAIAREGPILRS